jgi:hypothetical protein
MTDYEALGHGWRGEGHYALWIAPREVQGLRDLVRFSVGRNATGERGLVLELGHLTEGDDPEDPQVIADAFNFAGTLVELPLETTARAMFEIMAGFFLDDPGPLLARSN